MTARLSILILALSAALAAAACTASSITDRLDVGGECGGSNDACQSGLCFAVDSQSSVCTKTCAAVADCPAHWLCDKVPGVKDGKLCLPAGLGGRCTADAECPAGHKCDTDASRCYIPVSREVCSPCTSSKQCPTGGFCATVAATGEQYCTVGCTGNDCPVGFLCLDVEGAATKQCVPGNDQRSCHAGKSLCSPCRADAECGGGGDRCVRNLASGEQFCGQKCAHTSDCPSGFNCLDLSGEGRGPTQCVPNSQTCAGYCESDNSEVVRRQCGLGASCDTSARHCQTATDGRMCAACQDDDSCSADPTARCVANNCPDCPFKGEKFCATSCAGAGGGKDDSRCLAGFFCAGLGAGGASGPWHCAPTSGTCRAGAGILGDDCTAKGAAQCLSGLCLGFGSQGVCSTACHADGDCGDGRFKCCALVAGGKVFDCGQPPGADGGVCSPRGGGFGADCSPGQPPCFGGTCLDLGTARLCTKTCADGACPAGFSCRDGRQPKGDGTFDSVKVCFPDGGGDLGASCSFGPAACQSGFCLKKGSGNLCTRQCTSDTDCGDEFSCVADTALDGSEKGLSAQFCVPRNL